MQRLTIPLSAMSRRLAELEDQLSIPSAFMDLAVFTRQKRGLRKSPTVFAITFHPKGRRYGLKKRMNIMEKIFTLVAVAFAFLAGVTVYSDQASVCVGPNCVNSCAGNDC